MKKLLLSLSILAILLGMSSCSDDNTNNGQEDLFSGDNPFVGTWEHSYYEDNQPSGYYRRLVFSETTIESTLWYENNKYRETPDAIYTYTYNDTMLFYESIRNSGIREQPYNFTENILNFDGDEYKKISKLAL
jgi:hypothetical protein